MSTTGGIDTGGVAGAVLLAPRDPSGGPIRYPITALIVRYIGARERRGADSPSHIENMRRVLFDFASTVPDNPRRIDRRHVNTWMERPDLAPSTLRGRLSIIRNFFRWAITEGFVAKDPTAHYPTIEQPPAIPRSLRRDQAAILHVAYRSLEPRARLMICFEKEDGLRRVEVARAQVSDLDLRAQAMRVRGKARGGRAGVSREIAISDETVTAVNLYLSSEPGRLGLKSLASGPLFRDRRPSRSNSGITAQSVGKIVAAALYEIGVKTAPGDGVTGHALRHLAATEAVEAGVKPRTVQHQLGHAYGSTTEHYFRGAVSNLREFHEKRRVLRDDVEIIDLREQP